MSQEDAIFTPDHVAFIMDGNRRYADSTGITHIDSYSMGVERLFDMLEVGINVGVGYLTFFAFSTENWQRNKSDIDIIMFLARRILHNNRRLDHAIANGARIVFIGNLHHFDSDIQESMRDIMLKSQDNDRIVIQIAVSYGGRDEIVQMTRNIVHNVRLGKIAESDIDESLVSSYMMTSGIPDPDLLIRSGGERRISNFLTWQISYCELYFSDRMWPSFAEEDFLAAVSSYNLRYRRYGGD